MDEGGFVLARTVNLASEGEWQVVNQLLDTLPIKPESLTADTAYSSGQLRQSLEKLEIEAHIPVHPTQEKNMVNRGEFVYMGDHLLCPRGKVLRRSAYQRRFHAYQYVARQADCQVCPIGAECLPPRQKRRYVAVSEYHPMLVRALEHNRKPVYAEQMGKRKTVVEGIFASFDRLGWAKCKLRGMWKVDCEGFLAALAHNVLKAVRRFDLHLKAQSA